MRRMHIDAAESDGKVERLFGRLVVIMLLVAVGVLSVTTRAFASSALSPESTSLSAIVLSETEPGLVAAAPGTLNGPLTQADLEQITGSSGAEANDFGQALASGDLTAYIRAWGHQPSDGDAVVITAYQFAKAPDESAFLSSLDNGTQARAGAVAFPTPGIPGAIGSATHASSSGTSLTEYAVVFEKGNLVFEVETASASGDLTSANAVSLASQQFAAAPDTPASPGTNLNGLRLVLVPVGLALTIAIIVVGRKRKYPFALTGLPARMGSNGMPPAFGPPGPWGAPSAQADGPSGEMRPKVGAEQWQ
jgi:hypothetical protein